MQRIIMKIWIRAYGDYRMRISSILFSLSNIFLVFLEGFSNFYSVLSHVCLLFVLFLLLTRLDLRKAKFGFQGFLLGLISGFSIAIPLNFGSILSPQAIIFCFYAYVLAIFHFSEFFYDWHNEY